jgi:hypothetical protein
LTLAGTLKIQALTYIRVRRDNFICKEYLKRKRRKEKKERREKVVLFDPYDP